MTEKHTQPLDIHKADFHGVNDPVDWCSSTRLREQLRAEIAGLDNELEALTAAEGAVDFSQLQTCREMIYDRQRLFKKLRR